MRLCVAGASGRMGATLLRALPDFPEFKLAAALVSARSSRLGQDSGIVAGLAPSGIPCTADLAAIRGAALVIDFSAPAATASTLQACVEHGVPLLVGTTGLPASLEAGLAQAARRIPLLVAANTSVGIALLAALVRRAAAALGSSFDIEILEAHHRYKVDAPSGTALLLGEAAAAGLGLAPGAGRAAAGGARLGARSPGSIGYAVTRGGDLAGEHLVRFLGSGEELLLGHRAGDRSLFARGALQAGKWLSGRPPGRYQMSDFLGLN